MMARTKHTASFPGQGENRSQHPGVGPPNPTNSTPSKCGALMLVSCAVLMDCVNQGQNVVHRSGRQDSMPQIENVPWPPPCLLQNTQYALPYIVPIRKEYGRVKIALNAHIP